MTGLLYVNILFILSTIIRDVCMFACTKIDQCEWDNRTSVYTHTHTHMRACARVHRIRAVTQV